MDLVRDTLSWVLLLTGGGFALIGGLGLLRMPDFYTRLHAASVIDTGAVGLISLGLMLQAESWLVAVKLFIILAFLFFTAPTAAHAVAAAASSELKPWKRPDKGRAPPSNS